MELTVVCQDCGSNFQPEKIEFSGIFADDAVNASFAKASQEIHRYNLLIAQLERPIHKLRAERAALMHELDYQRSLRYPMNRMPVEIISEIISWACEPKFSPDIFHSLARRHPASLVSYLRRHLVLPALRAMSVSRLWNSLILHIPLVWRHVVVSAIRTVDESWRTQQMLQTVHARCHGAFHIYIVEAEPFVSALAVENPESQPQLTAIRKFMYEHAADIASIRIFGTFDPLFSDGTMVELMAAGLGLELSAGNMVDHAAQFTFPNLELFGIFEPSQLGFLESRRRYGFGWLAKSSKLRSLYLTGGGKAITSAVASLPQPNEITHAKIDGTVAYIVEHFIHFIRRCTSLTVVIGESPINISEAIPFVGVQNLTIEIDTLIPAATELNTTYWDSRYLLHHFTNLCFAPDLLTLRIRAVFGTERGQYRPWRPIDLSHFVLKCGLSRTLRNLHLSGMVLRNASDVRSLLSQLPALRSLEIFPWEEYIRDSTEELGEESASEDGEENDEGGHPATFTLLQALAVGDVAEGSEPSTGELENRLVPGLTHFYVALVGPLMLLERLEALVSVIGSRSPPFCEIQSVARLQALELTIDANTMESDPRIEESLAYIRALSSSDFRVGVHLW